MSDFARYPSLAGKVVLITGGATGIGAALVEAFHDQGAKVAFADVDATASTALAARLPGVWAAVADLRDPARLEQAIAMAAEALGPIQVLINNVADDTRHWAEEIDAAAWRANLAINLDPVFIASRAVRPGMAAAGGGVIINMSSINAQLGLPHLPAYVAAKGAILSLTKSLANAWGAENIRVNAISPGWVATPRQLALWLNPEAEAKWMAETALQTRILPDDVARLALFLSSDDARMITGQNHVIDGGRT